MYRTRQYIPSFVGVYIPPCSNILSSVNVCISDITTVCTTKVLAIANADMTAFVARLGSVCRWNCSNLYSRPLALVFEERTKLGKVPRVASSSESLVASLGVHTPSDILQVLNGYTLVFSLCLCYKALAYAVVYNGSKSSFTSFQPFQQLMAVTCAFGLNRSSYSVVFVPYVFDFIGGDIGAIRHGNYISKSHVNTDKILCVFFLFIGNIYRLIEIELFFDKDKVSFTICILHEVGAITSICYLLTPPNKRNGTYRLLDVVGKNTAVVGNSSELAEFSLRLSVKFVCVSYFADSSHDKLRRKMVSFTYRIIYLLMQTELLEDMTFPRYLRDSVTSLVENTEGLFQFNGLLAIWKKFNLQSQFHIAKIQNSFEIFKYLKEIIMLNSTKEGMVVQFLPEAKDFWVSLNQDI